MRNSPPGQRCATCVAVRLSWRLGCKGAGPLDSIRLDWIVKFGEQSYQVRELPKRREDGATLEMLVEAKI